MKLIPRPDGTESRHYRSNPLAHHQIEAQSRLIERFEGARQVGNGCSLTCKHDRRTSCRTVGGKARSWALARGADSFRSVSHRHIIPQTSSVSGFEFVISTRSRTNSEHSISRSC